MDSADRSLVVQTATWTHGVNMESKLKQSHKRMKKTQSLQKMMNRRLLVGFMYNIKKHSFQITNKEFISLHRSLGPSALR